MAMNILSIITHPNMIVAAIWARLFRWLPDTLYLKVRFLLIMGYRLDLNNPQTYNAKINWLKIFNRNPLYPNLVDKATVKEFVTDKIGEKYILPTLGFRNLG